MLAASSARAQAPLALHIHAENAMFQVLISPGATGANSFVLQLMAGDGRPLTAYLDAEAARMHDAEVCVGQLCLAVAAPGGREEEREVRWRKATRSRRNRTLDADAAVGGSEAGKRVLRCLCPGNPAHDRPAQARIAF